MHQEECKTTVWWSQLGTCSPTGSPIKRWYLWAVTSSCSNKTNQYHVQTHPRHQWLRLHLQHCLLVSIQNCKWSKCNSKQLKIDSHVLVLEITVIDRSLESFYQHSQVTNQLIKKVNQLTNHHLMTPPSPMLTLPFMTALCQIPMDVPVKYRFGNFAILVEGCGWMNT